MSSLPIGTFLGDYEVCSELIELVLLHEQNNLDTRV